MHAILKRKGVQQKNSGRKIGEERVGKVDTVGIKEMAVRRGKQPQI